MDPFPVSVVAVAAGVVAWVVVVVVAEAADRTGMAGTEVGPSAAVVSDSWHDQAAKATESEVVAKG
jgi:hypothetical protein